LQKSLLFCALASALTSIFCCSLYFFPVRS
jgi:hypothetical protein